MLEDTADVLHLPQRRNVRLDTLLRLRWLAIIGQTTAVAGGPVRGRIPAAGLGVPRGDRAVGLAQCRAAGALQPDPAARARTRGMAARLRYRRTRGPVVPHRRPGKSLRVPVSRAGAAVGDRAAAAHHHHARRIRRAVRHGAGVRALSVAVGRRRSARTALDLSARRLAFDPARDRLHRRLCLANHRGEPPDRRGPGRDRAGARARAASVAARRPGGGGRPRARHAAVDHLGDRQGARAGARSELAAHRRRAAAARAVAALPRYPVEADGALQPASRSTAFHCRR